MEKQKQEDYKPTDNLSASPLAQANAAPAAAAATRLLEQILDGAHEDIRVQRESIACSFLRA